MANRAHSLNLKNFDSPISQNRKVNSYNNNQANSCPSTHRAKLTIDQANKMNKNKYLSNKFHYVRSLNESYLAQYFKQSVQNSNVTSNNSVTKWLQDLRMMSENECLCVLQAKSLSSKLNQFKSEKIKEAINTEYNPKKTLPDLNIYEFLELAFEKQELISNEFSKLFKRLEKHSWQNIGSILVKLVNNMQLVIDLFNKMNIVPKINSPKVSNESFKIQFKENDNKLNASLNVIRKFLQNMTEENSHKIDTKFLQEILKNLDELFQKYLNNIVKMCVRNQLEKMNKNESIDAIKVILNQILEISLKNEIIKKTIIDENGILILFGTLKDPYFRSILDLILRALSILCSDLDSLSSLKKIDCFSILTDILCDEQAQEWTRTECAGCVAQITSPYLDFCDNLNGFLDNIEDLIRALTILCRDSSDIEIFLIGTAALANITFLDKIACEFLNQFGTAQVLIENYYLKQYNSIFVKDQITTILANMALLENCRYEISEFNGLNLLVDFLNERPVNYLNAENSNNTVESELNACERVQQKAAIAISRFCKEPKYTSQLIDLGVVSRISFLCRNSNERNNSDSVLVACLAALRQIAISSESLESQNLLLEADIQQLIKPKPNDSLLQCSSNEESYV